MNTICRNAAGLLGAGLCVAFASGAVQAQVQLFFEEPGFEWHVQGFNPTPYHIWQAGDYWAQTFPPTTLPTATAMQLRLFVDNSKLIKGASIDLDVRLNGIVVGQASITEGVTGPLDFNYAFGGAAAVLGRVYRVELLQTNTVPPGNGAASIGLDNQSWVILTGACYADCNTDTALTIADFACFQTKFVAADPYADCNQDSAFTIADFACFQTAFVAGCP